MLRTFCPFSPPQTTPPLPPEPMKYPLAISLTVPASSLLSYPHAQPMQLYLQLITPGIHQHLVCSVKTAAHQGSNWQTLSGTIEPTITHCTLFSALFGAISSSVSICMWLKRCLIFYDCKFQVTDILPPTRQTDITLQKDVGTMAYAHFLLYCAQSLDSHPVQMQRSCQHTPEG